MNRQLALCVIIVVIAPATTSTAATPMLQSAYAILIPDTVVEEFMKKASRAAMAISGENVYVVWPDNKTGNNEILFRASNDIGITFGDKINLSDSTAVESVDAQIEAGGSNIFVTWWERNQTINEPVMRE